MTTTHDINLSAAPAAPEIANETELRSVIHALAQKQLILDEAGAAMKARIELAKKAFADATAETAAEITADFARVVNYAAKHRAELFPMKGKKQMKTFKVLSHELQYRCSDSVEAPEDAAKVITNLIRSSEMNICNLGMGEHALQIAQVIAELETLLRHPEPEMNKEAVHSLKDRAKAQEAEDFSAAQAAFDLLTENGISVITEETFKIAFKFTPEKANP
jgi:hypothetical protein